MRTIVIVLLLVGGVALTAQAQMLDSIGMALQKAPRPAFRMDTRRSFVTSRPARMQGVKVGLNYGKKVSLGIGYNWLAAGLTEVISGPITEPLAKDTAMLKLGSGVIYFDYIFHQAGHWTLSMPLQLGAGVSLLERTDGSRLNKGWVVLYEPSLTAEYRFLRFFGICAGTGYRLMLKNNKSIDEQFTAPLYVLKGMIYFGDLYRAIAPRKS